MYSGLYSIIYNANLILDKLADDTPVKKRVRAEAQWFRALAHFELVTLWGNVPKIDHVLQSTEYRQAPAAPEDIYKLIEEDLTAASKVLPSKSSVNDGETGMRVTKETALAMLGKAYVFEGKWEEARTALDAVIDSKLYDLYPDYENVLKMVANNCMESIFEIQKRFDTNNLTYDMKDLMVAWRMERFDIDDIDKNYDILTMNGYGFMNPHPGLYEAFVAREGVNGYRLNATMKPYDDFFTNSLHMPIAPGKTVHGCEGYFYWKNRILESEKIADFYGVMPLHQAANPRIMRYAEVLLLAAEAHLQTGGKPEKAAEYINKIRTRAKLSPLGSVSMTDVKIEKRLELCDEGCRFQDLVRWGDAYEALKDQGHYVTNFDGTKVNIIITNDIYGFKTGKHELLPIPAREILLNPNMVQNPGW
jgi:tetratricopeptide (TPR) repeat protein